MAVCLERSADLHMTQLMPLPLNVSCCSKIQIGFTFLVLAHPGSPVQRAVKRVCVLQYDSRVLLFSSKCCLFNIASVLFVYLSAGNICRSPIAEAIFRNEVKKRGLTDQVSVVLFW